MREDPERGLRVVPVDRIFQTQLGMDALTATARRGLRMGLEQRGVRVRQAMAQGWTVVMRVMGDRFRR